MGHLDDAVSAYRRADAAVTRAREAAQSRIRQAQTDREAARRRLAAAIVAAAQGGMRQVDIIAVTGYSRERIRTILREGGVQPD